MIIVSRRNLRPRSTSTISYAATAFVLCCAVGCQDTSQDVSIQGQVSYQDKPITSGALTFFPTQGRPTPAVISQDGSYDCQLPPGKYRVTVTVGVKLPTGWKEGNRLPPPDPILPQRYTSRVKTPLRVTVADGQSEPVDFSLK